MKGFEPTLLEKLCADMPVSAMRRRWSVEQLKDAVALDLEWLLNARMTLRESLAVAFPESARSVLGYGLTDFAALSLASVHDRITLCQALERAITRHEPRLRNVQVALAAAGQADNALVFSIKALLVARPAQEPVSFDALLQPTTLQYAVNRPRARDRKG